MPSCNFLHNPYWRQRGTGAEIPFVGSHTLAPFSGILPPSESCSNERLHFYDSIELLAPLQMAMDYGVDVIFTNHLNMLF